MGLPSGNRRGPSLDVMEPRYLFNFVNPDGSRYIRQVYWENLYVFLPHGCTMLASARVVPHADELFAIYVALKYGDRLIHREMLPQLPRGGEVGSLARVVDDIMPSERPLLPVHLREQAALTVEMAVTRTLADHRAALPAALLVEGTSPADELVGWTRPKPGTLFARISLDPEDVAKVTVSGQVYAAIRNRMDSIRKEHESALPEDRAIAARSALGDDLERRLYSHPQYLRFVEWVMDAPGGLASPAVMDFLSYYYRCLAARAEELARRGESDFAFWQERLHSLLGRAEAEAFGTLPFHEITVLGYLQEGDLPVCEADPVHTGHSYQVDPQADLGEVVLREIRGIVHQAATRLFVAAHFRSNVKTIRHLHEDRGTQRPSQNG